MTPLYPISLRLAEQRVLIVGGGQLARQKLDGLAPSGAHVLLVAKQTQSGLADGFPPGRLRIERRAFRVADLRGVALAYGATDDPALNRRVVAAARKRGILANAVDDAEACDFYTPAVLRRHGVLLALSTSGAFPGLTRALREVLDAWLPEEHGDALADLYALRRALLESPLDASARGNILRELARRLRDDYLTPHPTRSGTPQAAAAESTLTKHPQPNLESVRP